MPPNDEIVTAAAAFIDSTLQNEGSWYRATDVHDRFAGALGSYGSSVGAIRGTVRDAGRKFKNLDHDQVTALASKLWGMPSATEPAVYERRLAAIVLLQSRVMMLLHSDLTRLEGFLRSARTAELAGPLTEDVVVPLIGGLSGRHRQRADVVLERWAHDADTFVRNAARAAAAQD